MSDLIYETEYAREMLLAAIKGQIDGEGRAEVSALIEQALNAGCDKKELIIELAATGAQLFARCVPDNLVALAHNLMDQVAC